MAVNADGSPIRPETYSKAFAAHCVAAGVPVIRLHDVRDTTATMLLDGGTMPSATAKWLGYDPAITLRVYGHVYDDALASAGDTLSGRSRATGNTWSAPPRATPRLPHVADNLERRRYDEREILRPSENLERTVLTMLGGWEMVRAQVNFNSFTDAGPDAEWAGSDKLAKTLREMALATRIRHPHDEWARVADEVSKVRHKFGHMLHLDEIEGEYPKRTLHFTRLGGEGEQRRGRGDSLGLSWRPDEWAQQTRHGDSVTEQELWETLEKQYWLIQVPRAVRRLGGILAESPDLPDDHPITGAVWYIPWRLPEWGEREDLVMSDLRLPPP